MDAFNNSMISTETLIMRLLKAVGRDDLVSACYAMKVRAPATPGQLSVPMNMHPVPVHAAALLMEQQVRCPHRAVC